MRIGAITVIAGIFLSAASADQRILRTTIDADVKTLNPIQNSELYSGVVMTHVYESLTTLPEFI
jgi:ABC-type oligopeptide transport system substrate-binding subunit